MTNYSQHVSTKKTPQSQPIIGQDMVKNRAGGYVYALDKWKVLERFLVIGSENGTYYASEKELAIEATKNTLECIKEDGKRVVDTLVAISEAGRAPKNEVALFVLAVCCSPAFSDLETRKYAADKLDKVARTPTHLFYFDKQAKLLRGWGRILKRANANWYNSKSVDKLAYLITKYRNREGVTHRDVLRLSHPVPLTNEHKKLYAWACGNTKKLDKLSEIAFPELVKGYLLAQETKEVSQLIALIKEHGLTHEMLPTEHLKSKEVWTALLENMPLTAMIRNLGRMTANSTLETFSNASKLVCERLKDKDYITKSRVHPMAILVAMKVYEQGHGDKGKLTWNALPKIVDALNDAFYLAFANVEPSDKRIMYAIDASGSMDTAVSGIPNMTCREAAVALAISHMANGADYYCIAFTSNSHIVNLPISPKQRLTDAMRDLNRLAEPNGTDLSLPLQYMLQHNVFVDALVMLTDNETWDGDRHSVQVLTEYRNKINPNLKIVVESLTLNDYTVNKPGDLLALDVVGFDTTTPLVVTDFINN